MDGQNAAAESADGKSNGAARLPVAPARTDLEEFSALLNAANGKEVDDGGEGESQDDPVAKPARKSKPKDLKTLAEIAELEDADLYAVEIPSARQGEKPYTIGALKDLAAKQDDFLVRSLRLDDDRRSFERERTTAEVELREILATLPAESVKAETVAKLRARIQNRQTRERGLMLERIPEWNDEKVRTEELQGIHDYLKGYDVPGGFLLENFSAGIMRMIRDGWRTAETVKKALAAVEQRKTNTPPKSKDSGTPPKSRAQSRTTPTSTVREASQVDNFVNAINHAAESARKR